MKKLLAIVVLGLIWSVSSYAQIIELDKCIRKGFTSGSQVTDWSEKSFNETNTIYYRFLKEPRVKKYGNNKSASVSDVIKEADLDKSTRKKYIKEGYKTVRHKDKDAVTIDTTRGTITTIFSYTDEYWNFEQEEHNRWVSASKKLTPNKDIQQMINFHNERQKTEIDKFKITDYVSGVMIGYRTDQERIYPNQRYSIKIDLNSLKVSEGWLNQIHNNPLVERICSNPKTRSTSINSLKKQTNNQERGTFKSILGNVIGK